MKKIIALLLALIMVFGYATVAFAESVVTCNYCQKRVADTDILDHEAKCKENPDNFKEIQCKYCGQKITEPYYNDHIKICYEQNKEAAEADTSEMNVTISNLFERFITVFDYNASWLDGIEGVVIRIMDLFEHIALYLVEKVDLSQIKTK